MNKSNRKTRIWLFSNKPKNCSYKLQNKTNFFQSQKAFDGSFDCKSVFRDNSEQVTSYESFPSTPGCDFINENAFSRSSQCALTAVCMNSLLLLSHLLLSFSLSLFSFAATCISSTYTYLEELMKCHLRICLFKVFSCLCMRSTELNVWTNNSFSVKSVSIGFRRNEIRDQSIPRILILFVQGGAVCAWRGVTHEKICRSSVSNLGIQCY